MDTRVRFAPDRSRSVPSDRTLNEVRIVVADDHEVVRTGLVSLLNATSGLRVVGEAQDGEVACRLAAELAPDVLLMDLSMPRVDGLRATARIHADSPGVAVLVLTMHDDRARLQRALQAGASGYVLKRNDADELVRAIRAVAAGRTYVDSELAARALCENDGRGPRTASVDHPPLSDREAEVLRRTAWGESNKQIANELGISTKTVETYKARITQKLGLAGRNELVRYAVEQGWLTARSDPGRRVHP
jgi:DNA-binding NarL/FixJ family response regulator